MSYLDEFEERIASSTAGPWKSQGFDKDAEFIAHAPEDIRALLAEVERLQAQIDAVKALHCQDAVQPRYCAECSDFGTDQFPAGELIEWPCPTIRALGGDQ